MIGTEFPFESYAHCMDSADTPKTLKVWLFPRLPLSPFSSHADAAIIGYHIHHHTGHARELSLKMEELSLSEIWVLSSASAPMPVLGILCCVI
jgi:hypothetical protein